MILAFTGAGISKASGIPTFEELGVLRESLSRTYASQYPQEYENIIKDLIGFCRAAKPNDAHYALAEYNIPIITMNIDELHKKAGSQNVLEIHGTLPKDPTNASLLVGKPILYGDIAPLYKDAVKKVSELGRGDIFLVIGASLFTGISQELREIAYMNDATIIEINNNAEKEVRNYLENISLSK